MEYKCDCCAHVAKFRCGRCKIQFYCGTQCQQEDWVRGYHYQSCTGTITYLATGYLMGTMHNAKITAHKNFTSVRGDNIMEKQLTPAQQHRLQGILILYQKTNKFHEETESDLPQCCDRGVARFIYNGQYARPGDVPLLAELFLELDPYLRTNPGGLYKNQPIF